MDTSRDKKKCNFTIFQITLSIFVFDQMPPFYFNNSSRRRQKKLKWERLCLHFIHWRLLNHCHFYCGRPYFKFSYFIFVRFNGGDLLEQSNFSILKHFVTLHLNYRPSLPNLKLLWINCNKLNILVFI